MPDEKYIANGFPKAQPAGYRFSTGSYELFQAIVVLSGKIYFSTRSIRSQLVSPGNVVLLREGSEFELACEEVGYKGVAFHVIGNLPDAFKGKAEIIRSNQEIRILADMMERYLHTHEAEKDILLEGLGRAIAWEAIRLSRLCESENDNNGDAVDWANIARNRLKSSIYSSSNTGEILKTLPLGYRQLARSFSQKYNRSPKKYHLETKIKKAKVLLRETDLSINSIASELGFASSQHFSTQFKSKLNILPSKYRKKHRHRV
jgi:AraC-like DNA-binding protein